MKHFICLFLLFASTYLFANSNEYLPLPAQNVVTHTYFTLSYNEAYEQANWVCYELTDRMINNSGEERSNNFKMDVLVTTGSAKSSDYTKSGYDRGHLCPAADMGFDQVAMKESFLMSNISPQIPDFNRGIWKELEATIRKWAIKEKNLIIITGPVFKDNMGKIGSDSVLVPGYFYKVIFDTTNDPRLIAFLLPNKKSNRPLTDFSVTTDEVEKLTGFDFFSQLPDELENRLEANVELTGWFEGYTTKEPMLAKQQVEQQVKEKSEMKFYLILLFVVLLVALFVFLKSKKRR